MTFLVEADVEISDCGWILAGKQRTRDMLCGDIVVGGRIGYLEKCPVLGSMLEDGRA